MITYAELDRSRIPWKPLPLILTPLDFPEHQPTIQRIIALGLHLELPVGEWVTETTKKDPQIDPDAFTLLTNNIHDEWIHYRAFKHAEKAYPVSSSTLTEAENIGKQWEESQGHPLYKAAVAETGVFLITLALMRILGGQSLATLAAEIGRDEQRHVATNRAILEDLGMNLHNVGPTLSSLYKETLDWIVQDIRIPTLGITKDILVEASKDLLLSGYSATLDELTDIADYIPSFEVDNSTLVY